VLLKALGCGFGRKAGAGSADFKFQKSFREV
jgi:hypothetical protein